MQAAAGISIEPLSVAGLAAARDELARLLRCCVDAGGSLNFLAPMADSDATDFWRSVEPLIASGERIVLVARDGNGGRIVGSAQLALVTKPNALHRAEVLKVMVDPAQRRRGIAAQLMAEIERHGRERSRSLLVLDTAEGPSGARAFYESLGYTYAGGIPDYALDPAGHPVKNAIYFKAI